MYTAPPLVLGHTTEGTPHTWAPTPAHPHLGLVDGHGAQATTVAHHLITTHLGGAQHRAEIITTTPQAWDRVHTPRTQGRVRVWAPDQAAVVAAELGALTGDITDLATTTPTTAHPAPVRALLVVDPWALVWGRRHLRAVLDHLGTLAAHGPRVGLHLVVCAHGPIRGMDTRTWTLATTGLGHHTTTRVARGHVAGPPPAPTSGRWAVATAQGWATITAPASAPQEGPPALTP